MFERFTDRARRVVVLAQDEARSLHHNHIGTEHILLGLIHEEEGVAARALAGLHVTLEDVRTRVEEIVGGGREQPGPHIPFTPRAKKVLELSLREALRLGHDYIGTEHILLGMIREGEGVAAQVLQRSGVSLDSAKGTVIRLLEGQSPEPVTRDETATEREPVTRTGPRCPSCRAWLAGSGRVGTRTVQDEDGRDVTVRVLFCHSCGTTIGVVA